MNIREAIALIENVEPEYYMTEGCGIFAYALSMLSPGGEIIIICNNSEFAERWSRTIPFELTHVAYEVNGSIYDVKGARTIQQMADDFNLGQSYKIMRGPPDMFKKKFMGSSDRFPLYGSKNDFAEAISYIRSRPNLYPISKEGFRSPNPEMR